MTACIDDEIFEDNGDGVQVGNQGYALNLKITLPVMTRHDNGQECDFEKYDNAIENIQLLFFYASDPENVTPEEGKDQEGNTRDGDEEDTESGNEGEGGETTPSPPKITDGRDMFFYSFSPGRENMIPLGEQNGDYVWYVRIPIGDNENDQSFADIVRSRKFKIAALANWPSNVNFGIGDDIHKLHKIAVDNSMIPSGSKDRANTYDFLQGPNGEMGNYTTWYSPRATDNQGGELKENAALDDWLRSKWNPALSANPPLSANPSTNYTYQNEKTWGRYSDLWFLWNFGGNDDSNAIKYPYSAQAWETRNGTNLRNWINNHITVGNEVGTSIESLEINTGSNINNSGDRNYLGFKSDTHAYAVKRKVNNLVIDTTALKIDAREDTYLYGVQLPSLAGSYGNITGSDNTTTYNRVDSTTAGVFSFTARAVGTLYVTARAEGNSATLNVQMGSANSSSTMPFSNVVRVNGDKPNGKNEITADNIFKEGKISITGDEQVIYLYNTGPDPLEIYQIEFVQGLNFYYTARDCVSQAIPMYGVQEYDELTGWEKGTTYDISNFNSVTGNPGSPIYLLRSVAKVEIKIPSSFNAHHVYLRCANHSARCEPMDVSTNTNKIFKPHPKETSSIFDECEHYSLIGRTPFYDPTSKEDKNTQLSNFKQKLAWYYGSWAKDGKLTGRGGVTVNVPKKNFGKDWTDFDTTKVDYPHIINPRIVRSDFIEFHYAGTDGGFDRFVLYAGEKFVDDPNNVGLRTIENENPKVCHIEFRINNTSLYVDPFYNLDDNNCYRVYFTENGVVNGKTPDINQGKSWESDYEQKTEILKKHWPIIRNHVYSFTVEDANSRYLSVKLNVLAWAKRDITVSW